MLKQITALRRDLELFQQIEGASTLEEVIEILTTVNPHLSSNDLLALVAGQEQEVAKLSEKSLLKINSGSSFTDDGIQSLN